MDGTILASILGFLAALLPLIFNRNLEGTVTDGSVDGSPASPVDAGATNDRPMRQADTRLSYRVLDALRSSVRPVLTYAFFGLFAAVKVTALYVAFFVEQMPVRDALPVLWDEGSEILLATVLSFWYGSRLMYRWRR